MGNDISGQLSFFSFFCRAQVLSPQSMALLTTHLSPSTMVGIEPNSLMLHLSIEQFLQLAQSPHYQQFFSQLCHLAKGSTLLLRDNALQTNNCVHHLKRLFADQVVWRGPKTAVPRFEYFSSLVKARRLFRLSSEVSISELNSIDIRAHSRVFLGDMRSEFIEVDMRGGTKMHKVSGMGVRELMSPPMTERVILEMTRAVWREKGGVRQMIARALEANSAEVDLLVEDIYGSTQGTLNLPGKLIASSLGKVAKSCVGKWSEAAFAKSLLMALAINLANTLSLYAPQCPCLFYLAYEVHHDSFYLLIQSILKMYAPQAQIWFLQNGEFEGCCDK